jgi:hypothetical protein
MKVIVAGGRDFTDYALLASTMDWVLAKYPDMEVVSGLARGADLLGKKWAEERGLVVHEFPALWEVEGRSAGYRRNERMATNADALVAFWDGTSRGTGHMIECARSHGLKVKVVLY